MEANKQARICNRLHQEALNAQRTWTTTGEGSDDAPYRMRMAANDVAHGEFRSAVYNVNKANDMLKSPVQFLLELEADIEGLIAEQAFEHIEPVCTICQGSKVMGCAHDTPKKEDCSLCSGTESRPCMFC